MSSAEPIRFETRPATHRANSRPPVRAAGKRKRKDAKIRRDHLLLDHWEEISQRLRMTKQIRLFLDFDGTLVGFHDSPDRVILNAPMQEALRKLSRHERVHAAIVSGRRRDILSQFLGGVPGIELMGLYGWENGLEHPALPPRALVRLAQARKTLAKLLRQLPEISVEDKGISLAVHFRGASTQSQRRARAHLRIAIAGLRPELHLIRAHSTWEVVPRQIRGKGAAIRSALKDVRTPYLPIYVGDDWTDEPAFALLRRGITVLVGPGRKTRAHFRLNDTGDVCTFLKRLEAELS